jgi:hypothetical protein
MRIALLPCERQTIKRSVRIRAGDSHMGFAHGIFLCGPPAIFFRRRAPRVAIAAYVSNLSSPTCHRFRLHPRIDLTRPIAATLSRRSKKLKIEVARMKTPGGWIDPSRRASNQGCVRKPLEHAEYDGADKSDCHIRGNNAQSADESHGRPPWFTSLSWLTLKIAIRSRGKKSALLSIRPSRWRGTVGNMVKKS